MNKIDIFNETDFLIDKMDIIEIIRIITKELSIKKYHLACSFMSQEAILGINKTHLGHDYYTDIITFNYGNENGKLEAEFYISPEEAENNSKRFKVKLKSELIRLIIHGILHCIGFNDKTNNEKKEMRMKENELINIIPNRLKVIA
ncbi:MAG: rRNA maturation RNase YbeY [Melioribacteraceae bacterium]|nr:rRNA maturation RNase YbeY [Melioribacteraceae bacterium]